MRTFAHLFLTAYAGNRTGRSAGFIAGFLCLLLLTGCNLTGTPPVEAGIPPTPTTVSMLQSTPVPTLARVYQPVPPTESVAVRLTDLNAGAITATPEPRCGLDPALPTTRHAINATLDYGLRSVLVDQTILYINRTGSTLNDLVLNVEPNRYPGAFTLFSLFEITGASDRTTPTFDLTGRRLLITLAEPLPAGCSVTLQLSFVVNIPAVGDGVLAFRGFFGHSDRQLNLGHWLPTVALRAGADWITRQAVFLGEQEVLTVADWDVILKVNNAGEALMVAAPGEMTELDTHHWRYTLTSSRDFTLSLSEQFTLTTVNTAAGQTVEVYTLPDAKIQNASGGVLDAGAHALMMSVQALETFNAVYGDYPYQRLLIVQGDFPDGMEFTGLVFVSTTWFKGFTGDPAGYLTLITVHEIAHQWWYATVGNDPALAPWLDEALATYSEFVFLEEYYPDLKDWWWQFRVENYAPGGFVDSNVYEFSSIREYINAVYLRGVMLLHTIRQDIGTEAFFDWLHRYADAGSGEVVTPNFFWSLLTPEQLAATERTRSLYLRQPVVAAP